MPEVMTQLHVEHRNIAKLLRALELQLAIFDATGQPDYDVISAIAEYFVGFPDRCHHPKEDLIYRKMRERDPGLAERLVDLESEHEKISALAQRFQTAVQNVLQEVEVSRGGFEELALHFVAEQRRHMHAEEEYFFPLALKTLSEEDWREIDQQVAQEDDPLFGGEVADEFAALRDDILKWELEDEALGG